MFPSADWTLVWNTLFDKLVLAAVLLALGYIVNRRLERFKSRESLRKSMAELRMPKIAAHLARFSELRAEIGFMLHANWVVANPMSNPPVDDVANLDQLRQERVEQYERFWNNQKVLRSEGMKKVEEAGQALERDRFWVGSELCDVVLRQYRQINSAFSSSKGALVYGRDAGIVDDVPIPSRSLLTFRNWRELKSTLRKRRDERMLERYGLSGDFTRADVDRMIERVSNVG
jgi:hypothetical protein